MKKYRKWQNCTKSVRP